MTRPERRRRGLRFASKIVLLLVLLVLAAQAATLAVTRFAVERSVREQIARELDVGERVWQRFHETRSRQLLDRVAVLAEDFGFRDAVTSGDVPTMTSALANAGGRIGADAAWLLDRDGGLLVSLLPSEMALTPGTLAVIVNQAARDGHVGGVVVAGDRAYQLALVPVFAPTLVAWVGLALEFGDPDVSEFAAITRLDAGVLVRRDGLPRVLASTATTSPAPSLALEWDALAPAVQDVLLPDDRAYPSARALRVSLDPQQPVFVLVQAAREEAMAPFADLGRQVLVLSALAGLIALAVALLVGRRVSRPVEQLADAAARVQRGEYADPVAVAGSDELARLADAFNRMQAGIAEREATIRHQAGHDRLTGLPNRERALQLLTEAWNRAQQAGAGGAVLTLDLDRFKEINDTLGHAFGDRVLNEVAARLREAVRSDDTVARLGADEFLVLLPDIDAEGARKRADLLAQALRLPLALGEAPILLDASLGLALFPQPGADAEAALRRAEIAMYDAKLARSRIAVYAPGREEQHLRQLRLIGDLRRSIEHGELELVYQPKIELASGRVEHAEALLRWSHPELGGIGPDEFVPLAERSGFIHALTLHVLDRALAQVRQWADAGLDLGVAVNLSADDLLNDELAERVQRGLRRHAVRPARLILEVTESAVMRDLDRSLRTLHAVRRLGIRIAIDDFGTGHSSLAQLKRLPVDELKIDKSFVLPLAEGGEDELIVRAIIDLAHTLSLRVVAEGVETITGLELLRRHGCELGQGYHFSRPLAGEALAEWLRVHAPATLAVATEAAAD